MGGFASANEALKLKARRSEAAGSILDCVGMTPLVLVERCLPPLPDVEIFAKLELFNPGGSLADRCVSGGNGAGQTSWGGDAGVSMAMAGAALGRPVRGRVASSVTATHRRAMSSFGAEVAPCEGAVGSSYPVNADQVRSLAREIYDQTCGRLTHVVAYGGWASALTREIVPHVPSLVAVEVAFLDPTPGDAAAGPGVVSILRAAAQSWASKLHGEGLRAGPISGLVLAGGVKVAAELVARGESGMIVCLFADRAWLQTGPALVPRPPVW